MQQIYWMCQDYEELRKGNKSALAKANEMVAKEQARRRKAAGDG